jgi:hypothetical protein
MKIYKQLKANNISLKKRNFSRELLLEAFLIQNEELLAIEGLETDNVPEVTSFEHTVKKGDGSDSKGRIDLIIKYDNTIGIAELKKEEVNHVTIDQLNEYISTTNVDRIIKDLRIASGNEAIFEDNAPRLGIVIGTSIDSKLANEIVNDENADWKKDGVEYAAIVINRYESEDLYGTVFTTTETYFKSSKARDLSKYTVNGNKKLKLGKGRLVQYVVRELAKTKSLNQMKDALPKNLQGANGVFVKEERAIELLNSSKDNRARFFMDDSKDDVIELNNGTRICVCNQWGITNISKFIEHINKCYPSLKITNIT